MSEMIKSSHDAVVGRKRPEAVDIFGVVVESSLIWLPLSRNQNHLQLRQNFGA
jgi:hypothetical protein